MRVLPGLLLSLSLVLPAMHGHADEGMWQPAQLPDLEVQLKARGLDLEPEDLARLTEYPLGAIVGFGFCTASFVSPDGLVVTNHHCAYGAIQYNSTPERNLLADGFLAATHKDELPAEPTMRIFVTESIEDVTARITEGLDDSVTGTARHQAIDRASKAVVAECEATPGYRCDVYVFHQGLSFQLVRQLEVRDVRLVYAPASAIGKFGGDIDNWMWPRHTGDFSFLRAYVGPDGKPAAYSEDNVPYKPRHHLKVQPEGVSAGDFVMVTGYPGRTNRYRLSEEVRDAIEWQYPTTIELYQRYVDIVEGHPDAEARLKYAGNIASWNNTLKNFGGQIEGLRRADAVAVKARGEEELERWLDRNRDGERLKAGVARLREELAKARGTRERDLLFRQFSGLAMLRAGYSIERLAMERGKPDAEREYGFQQRDEARLEGFLRTIDRRFDPAVEVKLGTELLVRYARLPADQRIAELDAWLDGASTAEAISARLTALYAGSSLTDPARRLEWFAADLDAIKASDDALLRFVDALMPAWLRAEEQDKQASGNAFLYRPQYMQAMIDYNRSRNRPIYPDANNSLRVSYGTVTGYSPRDGMQYLPFTTLEGLAAKHTGEDPFDATQRQLDEIAARRHGSYADPALGSVPVNFLADLDITGGNSGSPTLNGKGELIGLAFDGNIESVSASWLFEPAITRSIHVDVRYMLWVMDVVDGAHHLLREMGLSAARR
ncbi:S46 family peptidase [Pseudofulvimonas gallinarii]|jgi:hypothetical protein|uniref:Dipeptidyl-peptidase n=1 Tax=Pseudofulvimonas gallinarii TaxID=634155 RepID=A0A4R3LLL1_9GAMM|nr:S46 family peptidase [Pseudofulvimonas gallinarii]TCT00841.1 peptidase S46-like protein [Pseudofulvimonas gallinarii]THD12869.1 dipeptidyl-peptidase 7 [Pseudofulvimonas gallinarii]